jgi:HD-GYP domain-containing protein (c-di-GMP phosphodiesterase class II)
VSVAGNQTKVPLNAAKALVCGHEELPALYLPGEGNSAPVLYRERGAHLNVPDFERLRESGVKFLIFEDGALSSYERALEQRLGDILRDPSLTPEAKASSVHVAGTAAVREILENPGESPQLERVSNMLDVVIENVLAQPAVGANLLRMSSHHQCTASHMFAVGTLSVMLGAEVVGLDPGQLRNIGLAGMFHDLGKLQIPSEILGKAVPLTSAEYHQIQQHTIESVRLLGDNPLINSEIRLMILQHHERIDGAGYPLGLRGDEIVLGAKLLSIVDSFHAIIGRRSYRGPTSPIDAMRILKYEIGRQFDRDLYRKWVHLFSRYWNLQISQLELNDLQGEAGLSYHSDHRSSPRKEILRNQPRLCCRGRVQVRCKIVRQLIGLPARSTDMTLALLDLSRGGLCMFSPDPMYRGEVVNLCLSVAGAAPLGVRAVVAWCRKEAGRSGFKVGIRLTSRIPAEEIGNPQLVHRLAEDGESNGTPLNSASEF